MAHTSDTGIFGSSVFLRLTTLRLTTLRLTTLRDTVATRYGQYQTYRKTLRELESLTKRELNDLGLNQYTLQAVAREAAYGEA
jgi:uncharacterized protein YjiS (DUF1127 family)